MMVGPIKKVTGGLPLTACVLICLTLTPAMANDPLAELKVGVPGPVGALIERFVYCTHWAGEESYDAARRAEINHAIKDLRCTALDRDEKRILKVYGKDERVRNSIKKAKEGIL